MTTAARERTTLVQWNACTTYLALPQHSHEVMITITVQGCVEGGEGRGVQTPDNCMMGYEKTS